MYNNMHESKMPMPNERKNLRDFSGKGSMLEIK